MNNKIVLSLMLIFLISAVSALSVNVAAPSAGTIIDSSVTNYNIVFDLNHDTNSLIDANIFLDTDTNNSSFTKKLTSMNSLSIGTQSFSWDTNASDGNYYIYVNAKSVDGNTANDYSDKFTVKKITVDSTPPVTDYNGFTNDAWRKTSATVSLTCTDSGSGCNKTFYNLNDTNFIEYTAQFTVSAQGTTTLSFYSTDNSDNNETGKTATIKIDSNAPTTPTGLTATAAGLTINLSWTASTDVNGSGIKNYFVFRKNDSNVFVLIASPATNSYSDTGLTHGKTYYYKVKATDNADNDSTDSNEASTTATDSTAPSVSSNADDSWHSGTVTITLTCSDSDGVCQTIYWKLNGTDFSSASNPASLDISSEGSNSLEFWAIDNHNNTATHITQTVKIDKSAPNAPSLSSPGANSNGEVSLSWSKPSDNPSSSNSGLKGYKIYRKTGSESYSSITTITNQDTTSYTDTGRSQGTTYYYKVTAIDNLGQESSLDNSNEQQVTMPSDNPNNNNSGDGVPPTVSWSAPNNGDTLKDMNITLKAFVSDTSQLKFISFTYKKTSESSYHTIQTIQTNTILNGTKTIVWNTSGIENGEYELKVLARDAPGNVNSKTIKITLDREGVISVPDENSDENKSAELLLAEETINKAKQSKTESMDLISYWKKMNLDFSSDEKVTEANTLLNKAEQELQEEKLTECITDAEQAKQLFDEFNQTEVKEYKTQSMDSENELNLSANLSNENEKLKKEITTTRQMQLIEINHDGETFYQENTVLKIKNTSDKTKTIQLIEVIPKELIESASLISSNFGFTIIENDPVIKWEIELNAGEEKEIVYSSDTKLTKEEADQMNESKISFEGNPVVLNTKTKIDSENFASSTGFLVLGDLFPAGIAILIIAVLVGAFLFLKSKGIFEGTGKKEEETKSFNGLAGVYSSSNFREKKTLREDTTEYKRKVNPLNSGESGGRFSYKGD